MKSAKGKRVLEAKQSIKCFCGFHLLPCHPPAREEESASVQRSVGELGTPVGVCVLQDRYVWSSVFPTKRLRVCQEHEEQEQPGWFATACGHRIT